MLLVTIATVLSSTLSASAGDLLVCPDSFKPSAESIAQSNAFALGAEINDPLLDGWQHEGFKILIDPAGKYGQNLSSSLCVDKTQDPVLRDTIREAAERYGRLPAAERAAELTKFAHRTFSRTGLNDGQLSDWDDSFGNQHRSERILIGEYIRLGKGVCEQQAVLLKVLADQLGLKSTLWFGFNRKIGHVWTTISIDGRNLVFDPAQEILGASPGELATHKSIRQLYGDEFDTLSKLQEAKRFIADKKFSDAEAVLKQLADLDRRKLGATHPSYAISLERIADLYRLEQRAEKAEPYLERALQAYRYAWGNSHQQVADALNQLANLERELDKNTRAERMYKQAIRIYESRLGKDDTAVADPLFNLADLYLERGKLSQSKVLFKRALDIYRRNKGSNHQDTLDTKAKLDELAQRTTPEV